MRRPKHYGVRESEVTDEAVFAARRKFISGSAASVLALTLGGLFPARRAAAARTLGAYQQKAYGADLEPNPLEHAETYNNFYELGTDKADPVMFAKQLKTEPWSVVIDGEVGKPGSYGLEDLLKPHTLEERVYRLRCVEAWSMVIPWIGFPLGDLLKRVAPTSRAKYVAFTSIYDPLNLPGQSLPIIPWPYAEGLRIDEAMHPLTILAVGMYGKTLPNQNGAPIRLVVPWKYGFKSAKSIVKISLTETQPPTAWNMAAPREYGFYANVNPAVSHPRWSQKRERRLGEFFKRDTLMFNGYEEAVSSLYSGMDLRQYF